MRARGTASVAGAVPWCRRRKLLTANQTIASGFEEVVTWNSIDNDYSGTFQSSGNGIEVLVDGLYAIVCRIFWDTVPTTAEVLINQIDPDGFAGYNGASVLTNLTKLSHVSTTARLEAGQIPFITVRQSSGVNKTIWGTGGSYMELRFLGSSTVSGRDS